MFLDSGRLQTAPTESRRVIYLEKCSLYTYYQTPVNIRSISEPKHLP